MIKKRIKDATFDAVEDISLAWKRRNERNKNRDKRYLNIIESYPLTAEQRQQIDDLFVTNYGKRVDYKWHQNYAAHAGKFDYRFFPELLYVPEFEAFQNHNKGAALTFEDKNLLPLVARITGVKTPRTIVSCTNGLLRDGDNNIITPSMAKELVHKNDRCFIKPSVSSSSGQGCCIINEDDDVVFSYNTLKINRLRGYGCRQNFVVQEFLVCHDSIRVLYPGSVNTFRVITYLWKNNIEVMPIIIRMGQGGHFLDNAHQGGMFCAVKEDGTMGRYAVTEFNNQFKEHPDTHTIFANHKIEHVDKVIMAARQMHIAIPQVGVVNWDFTIDKYGEPVLIEANISFGSVWLPQMAHGVGAFGDKTAEVLQWLCFMKKLKPHERTKYAGGLFE